MLCIARGFTDSYMSAVTTEVSDMLIVFLFVTKFRLAVPSICFTLSLGKDN
jgi:hypothetical protein